LAAIIFGGTIGLFFFGGNFLFSFYIILTFLGLSNEYFILDYYAFRGRFDQRFRLTLLLSILIIALLVSYGLDLFAQKIKAERPLADFHPSLTEYLSFAISTGIALTIIYYLPIAQAQIIDVERYRESPTKVSWWINGIYIIFLFTVDATYLSYLAHYLENQLLFLLFPIMNLVFLMLLIVISKNIKGLHHFK